MYRTCLFCHTDLGTNEVIEPFPVGRRLAFDAAKGRLWVVCRKCERWNLTPLEERWEAIEECERRFRDTRLRVSTDNIGLARLREGLELVRVGEPQRPEFAAWRYGDQFGCRRRRALLIAGASLGAVGALVAGGVVAGVGIGGFGWTIWNLARNAVTGSPDAVLARVPLEDGGKLAVKRKSLSRFSLVGRPANDEWHLVMHRKHVTTEWTGQRAKRVVSMLLPKVNRFGATKSQVSSAVERIERAGDPARFLGTIVRDPSRPLIAPSGFLGLTPEDRVAFEMALHEESERRAMEGELTLLESAWKEAEEIAGIADDMFLPKGAEEFLAKHRPVSEAVRES